MCAKDITFGRCWESDAGSARSLQVQWLGVAGFRIECQGHVVLVDPYLSRASLRQCLLGPLSPDRDLLARCLPRADTILVGHSHYDHVSDVPEIAKQTGAQVYGSWSTARLGLAQGVPPGQVQVVQATKNEPACFEVGPFRCRFVLSEHARLLGRRIPFPGDIDTQESRLLRFEEYRCGAVQALELSVDGLRIVHLGTAKVPALGPQNTDLLLLCAAGWRSSPDYPEQAVGVFRPRTIVLSHWDDFTRPLHRPLRALPAVGLRALKDRLKACPGHPRVEIPGICTTGQR